MGTHFLDVATQRTVGTLGRLSRLAACLLMLGAAALTTAADDQAPPTEERPPGLLDTACAAECRERGYDGEHCTKTCWVPEVAPGPPDGLIDQVCLRSCLDRGGRFQTCKPGCQRD